MKFSQFLKRNVCHAVLLGFISQLCGTFALAAQQQSPMSYDQQTSLQHQESQEAVLASLIMQLIEQAITNAEGAPSQALLRCYQRVRAGNDTLVMEDLVDAMSELVSFAMLQYEKNATRSQKEDIFDTFNKKYAESTFAHRGMSTCGFYKWLCDLSKIKKNLKKCCKQICIDFKHTWSLIEECCEETQSLIEKCCKETQSLIEECCELTTSNFEHTWSLIEECCEQTHSRIDECCKETQSLIEECCEQTQSNFEFTWSLIEHLHFDCTLTCDLTEVLTTLSACCAQTQSLIEECCEQTQSNFEFTWSLIEHLHFDCTLTCDLTEVLTTLSACCVQTQSLIEECCEQTQSNFEFTWSLIEHLHFDCTLTCDLTEVLTTLSACCLQTQSNFEHTWSLIEECCEETHSLIVECCEETQSLIEECCEQTQSNFEFTWSLIEHLHFDCTLTCDLTEVLTTLSACCEQTQSNFEFTWSLIEHLNVNCDLTEVLTTLSACCEQTQSNFQTIFSLINDLKETVTDCCAAVTGALGSKTDEIVSFTCTTTAINDLDASAISLLKTLLYQNCSTAPQWVLTVDEPLDSGASLSQFTQTDGVWTQVGDHVNTAATSPSNFLQYNFPIQETYEVLEVDIEVPSGLQPTGQGSCAAGLLSNWNGSNSSTAGPSVAFFNWATDGSGNITGTPKFVVETFFGGLHTEAAFPGFAYDTVYNVRLERIPLQQTSTYITAVYIDGVLTLISPASGSAPGDFIGLWAFQATANFKNFKSWSAAALPLLILPPL